MTDIIVFESANEVIVGAAANINTIIEDWFLNGERNLDEYNAYLADGSDGVLITTSIRANVGDRSMDDADFDVTALMPNVLRKALIENGLLTDEG